MEVITIDDVEHPPTISPADVFRPLSGPLGATDVAINHFELEPGETFGFDYHRHLDQEELFVVLAGTATFRTEIGEVDVAAGEAIRFAPGELQLGRNEQSGRVVALAIGAPPRSKDIEYLRRCSACGEETVQTPARREDEGVVEIRCEACSSATAVIELVP